MDELVSIIMPSYNTGSLISQSIESVINQTYSLWELIIVDDNSNDDTDSVVKQYLSDKRIKYYKNERNCGAAVSRNIALKNASGKWIAFLDSDDLWYPNKLDAQISFMKEKGISFSYTQYCVIDEDSKPTGIIVSGPKHISRTGFYNYCWPGCLTVMYDAEKIGCIQIPDIKKNNDYAMWLLVSKKADCFLLADVLAKYRKRSGSISNHSYISLIKWHYKLYHDADNRSMIMSCFNTARNIFFGLYKKMRYVKRLNNDVKEKQ